MTADRLLLHGQTLAMLLFVRLLLVRLGVERTLRLAVRLGGHATEGTRDGGRVIRAVRRVARYLVPDSACLAQSITVVGLLSATDADPELVLGCRLTDGGWVAHAWVQCGEQCFEPVLGGPQVELGRYGRRNGWRLRSADAPRTAQGAHPGHPVDRSEPAMPSDGSIGT